MSDGLDTQQMRRLRDLFYRVELLSPEEQKQLIAKECADDEPLARELMEMLSSGTEADEFFSDLFGVGIPTDNPDDLIGLTLDRYQIKELVGSGGMGFVYRAEHESEDVDRVVAIKILRSTFLNWPMQQRFKREAKILAQLDHPNIARFIDIGQHEGRPYFIMEFVDGVRIDSHCADNKLSIPDRLRLFQTVLKAIAFTQRHLIIHRDLKPQNIFVAHDGAIKVLDFGIGKFLEDEPHADESLTRMVGPMLTPEIAAPEQWNGDSTTTATDVYALAVVLFKLLCDAPPYARDVVKRMGISGEWPDDPPGMAGVLHIEGHAMRTAQNRKMTVKALRQTLRGDLQAIVGKAMSRAPEQRYDTAFQFNQDIDNYLSHRPLMARPANKLYTLRKFLARNARATAFAAAIAILISALVLQVYFESVRETLQAAEIARERDKALASAQLLKDVFSQADPALEGANNVTVREALVNNAPRLLSEQQDSPKVQIALAGTVGQILNDVGALGDAEGFLDLVVQLASSLQLSGFSGIDEERAATDARLQLLNIYVQTGRFDDALKMAHEVEPLIRRHYGDVSNQMLDRLNVLTELHSLRRATDDHQRAADAALQYARAHPQLGGVYRASAINNHAMAYRTQAPLGDTLRRVEEARQVALSDVPATHPLSARLTANLAAGYATQGDFVKAKGYYENVVAIYHQQRVPPGLSLALAHYGLGVSHLGLGEFKAAEKLFADALGVHLKIRGDQDYQSILIRFGLASSLDMNESFDAAKAEYSTVAQLMAQRHPDDPGVAKYYARLAALEVDMGDHDAAARNASTAQYFLAANPSSRDKLTPILLEAIAACLESTAQDRDERRRQLQVLLNRVPDNTGPYTIPLIKMKKWLEET